ncbi:MAG TPA: molybdopterin-dependent oxidoreductase [bacterium]|nr:molybdopterin-dependent oxidoreductase [bacterium]
MTAVARAPIVAGTALAVVCVLLTLAVGAPGGVLHVRAQPGGYARAFDLTGVVRHPARVTLADLQRYPVSTLRVEFLAGTASTQAEFAGVPLWVLVSAAGVVTDPRRKNDLLRKYVVVTGSDGYQAVIAVAEMLQDYGNQAILVAYRRDGAALPSDEGMARLVVPGDKRGGRYVDNIVRIEVRNAGT